MDVFDLLAKLTLDTSEYENGLNNAKGSAEKGGSKIGAALGTAGKVAGAAIAAATTAAVGFGKTAVDASISYESAFTGVTKTVEETATTSYDMISDAIMKMATETSSSKEVIAGVMEAAGQLGVSADDIVGFTQTMIELGDTTNLSAEEAAVALARFTNITGLSSGDVDKLGSAIVDLGNNFATDEAAIVSMSTRLASAGTIAGMSSTDILALSTAMSSVGIEAEAGGTAMSQVLTKIGNAVANGLDSEKLKTFAEVAGMSAEEFSNAWKAEPVEALSQFIIGLNGVNESGGNVNVLLEDLGIKGIRESNMIKSLALASDVLTDAVKTSSTAFEENSALSEEANKRYGTMESQLSQLKEAYSNMKVTIGDELMPTLSNFIEFGKNGMTELTTAFQQDGLAGALDALGPILDQGVEMIFNMLPTVVDAGIALLEGLISGILKNLPTLVDAAVKIITTLVQDIADNIDKVLDAAVEIIFALADGLIEALPELIPAIVEIILKIVEKLTDPETQTKLIEASFKIIAALAEGLINALPELIKAVPVLIKNLITNILNFMPNMVKGGEELVKGIAEGILNMVDAAIDSVKQLLGKIKDAILGIVNRAKEWGADMIQNFTNGIKSKVSGVVSAVSGIASKVKSFLGFSEPEEGPLSNFSTYAPDMMKLFAKGIKDNEHLVTDQIRSSFDFGNLGTAAAPALAGSGTTTNTYNITVNGIEELEELLEWYNSRQVRARMA